MEMRLKETLATLLLRPSTMLFFKCSYGPLLGPKFHKKAHSMKCKERSWTLTKEGPIHEVKKDHEGRNPKNNEKEINNNNKKKKKKEDLDLVRPEDMQ